MPCAQSSALSGLVWRRLALLACLGLAAASPRQDAVRQLTAAEHARARKIAAASAASRAEAQAAARTAALAQQRVEAAARLRDIESRVDSAAQSLADATAAHKAADDAVQERANDLSGMLPMALRLSEYPAETMLAAPVSPEKAVEGLMATQGISAELARQVVALRAQQAEAAKLQVAVKQKEAALAAERAHQKEAARMLDQQIGNAHEAQQSAGEAGLEATEAAAALATRADDLRSAISAMDQAERDAEAREAQEAAMASKHATEQAAAAEKQRKQLALEALRARRYAQAHPDGPTSATKAAHAAAVARADALAAEQQQAADKQRQIVEANADRARLAATARTAGPGLSAASVKATLVAGRLVRGWGEAGDDGKTTGATFSTAPAAFVASPCAGRVGFAAPFRSYGKLMIIECGKGYDFVVAGMERMDVSVGHSVRAGEPIGRMADFDAAGSADHPGLYVELRRNGVAIDPMPYLNRKS